MTNNKAVRERIEREFFRNAAVRLEWNLEGQKIENNLPVIGARAGPEIKAWNLLHEMAHFVEIDDDRMCSYGWGLRVPEVFVYDRMCVEPTTTQMTKREIRVIAFQRNVMVYLGMEEPASKSVNSLHFLPDHTLVPLEDGSPAYIEGRPVCKSLKQTDKSRMKWIANQVEALQSKYTLEFFISEWERKNQLLS